MSGIKWVCIYEGDFGVTRFGKLYDTREEAESSGKPDLYYKCTAKIEFLNENEVSYVKESERLNKKHLLKTIRQLIECIDTMPYSRVVDGGLRVDPDIFNKAIDIANKHNDYLKKVRG